MSDKIYILELPFYHIEYLIKLLRFSTENPSLKPEQVRLLREIEEHIVRQTTKD